MADCVLDASVILAFLAGEPGAEEAAALIPGGLLGAVNQAEVIGKLVDWGFSAVEATQIVGALGCEIAVFDPAAGAVAGQIHARTRGGNISLGDRCCLALGQTLGLPVVTADRAWASLDLGADPAVAVRLLR